MPELPKSEWIAQNGLKYASIEYVQAAWEVAQRNNGRWAHDIVIAYLSNKKDGAGATKRKRGPKPGTVRGPYKKRGPKPKAKAEKAEKQD